MRRPIRFFTACLALTIPPPALADEQLNRALLGIGQLILNQSQQPQQVQPMSRQVIPGQVTRAQPQQRATAPAASAETRRVQQSLNALGYDAGQPDGRPGRQTQQAIMAWQQGIGAAPTGTLTAAQRRSLLASAAPQTPAAPPRESLPRAEMARLQHALTLLGYYGGASDGLPGRKTAAALSGYLRDRGHDPDAISLRDAQAMILAEAGGAVAMQPAPGWGDAAPGAEAGWAGQAEPVPATPAFAAGTGTSPVADLPTYAGAAVIMGDDTSGEKVWGYRAMLGGDEARADLAVAALERLWSLYALKAEPGLLDDMGSAADFLFLLPEDAATRFGSAGRNNGATRFDQGWRGDNQFQREDSYRAFVAEWRARLIAMTAALPEELIFVSDGSFGAYDAARGTLAISGGSRLGWDGAIYANHRLKIPDPYRFPESVRVDAATARGLFEGAQADYDAQHPDRMKGGVTPAAARVMQRYRVAGLRAVPGKPVVLDLIPTSIAFHDLTLRRKLLDVPLPGNFAGGGGAEGATAQAPQLDALYPRLWLARAMPALLDDPAFVAETFRLRRKQEAGKRPYSYEPVVATAMRETELPPTADDLQSMRDWLQRHAADLPAEVKVDGFGLSPVYGSSERGRRASIKQWIEQGGQPQSATGKERSWIKPSLAAAAKIMPDSMEQHVLWSGDGVPAVVTLHPHPAWAAGIAVEFEPMGERASLDLKIVEARMVMDAGVPPFLLFDVLPAAVSYQRDGKTTRIALDQPAQPVEATRRFDIAGMRLDMPLAEAEQVATAFLGGTPTREEWQFQNGALTDAVALFTPDTSRQWKELLVLFYDGDQSEKPLIGVGRQVITREFSGNRSQGMAALLPRLEEKFGKSYRDGGGAGAYWAADPVTLAKLEAGIDYQDPCSQSDYEQFFMNPSQGVRFSSKITQGCGEMLSLTITTEAVHQLLTDTDVLAARWAKMEAAKPPPTEPGAAIKF